MNTKKKWIKTIGIGVAVLGIVGACMFSVTKPKTYKMAKLEEGTVQGIITESGIVEGEEEKTYYAAVSSPILKIDFKEGDTIEKGSLLLTYDLNDLSYEAQLAGLNKTQSLEQMRGEVAKSNQNESRYKAAQENEEAYEALYAEKRTEYQKLVQEQYADDYDKLEDIQDINIQISILQEKIVDKQKEISSIEKQITSKNVAVNDRNTEIRDLQAQIAEAQAPGSTATQDEIDALHASLEGKSADLSSLLSEIASLSANADTLEDKIEDYSDKISDLEIKQAGKNIKGLNPEEYVRSNADANDVEDTQRQWEQASTSRMNYESTILTQEQKTAMQAGVDLMQKQEERAREELEKGENGILADFDGIVSELLVKEGAYVQEGTPLFTLQSTESIKAVVKVSRYDIGQVELGQKCTIDMAGKIYEGKVSKIGRIAVTDSTGKNKIEVEVTLDEPDDAVILGIEADVSIQTGSARSKRRLPYVAYYEDEQGAYCYTIQGGTIEKVYFEAGIVGENYVEIRNGLEDVETVIIDAVTDEQVGVKAIGNID